MEEKKEWYVVNTYSGHENKVKEDLEMRAESMGMQDNIIRVIVPEEKVIEEKNGVKKEKVKKPAGNFRRVLLILNMLKCYAIRKNFIRNIADNT